MSLSTALWIAGAVTLLVTVFIGEKIIDPDFSGLQPQNRKKAKRARLLAARATPLEGTNLRRFLYLLAAAVVLYLCVFLCPYLIPDTEISLAAGVGAACLVWVAVVVINTCQEHKQDKLAGKIVRYSENYLRACINEALYRDSSDKNLLEHSIDTILLKSVRNTGKITELTAVVQISET